MRLSERQQSALDAEGHVLVTGGPGSGKTTVAILKAARIAGDELRVEQRALFLGFARATVSRVLEAIALEHRIPTQLKRAIEVDTYHSFFWRILKTHGYLTGLPRRLAILTPTAEAIALSEIRLGYPRRLSGAQRLDKRMREEEEQRRLAFDHGLVCFDLFAPLTAALLHSSGRIRRLVTNRYPTIILDEFQDTNAEQWDVVRALGEGSSLVALADPEQRIYDWIGADPERLNQFRGAFDPAEFNLRGNFRSPGTTSRHSATPF